MSFLTLISWKSWRRVVNKSQDFLFSIWIIHWEQNFLVPFAGLPYGKTLRSSRYLFLLDPMYYSMWNHNYEPILLHCWRPQSYWILWHTGCQESENWLLTLKFMALGLCETNWEQRLLVILLNYKFWEKKFLNLSRIIFLTLVLGTSYS